MLKNFFLTSLTRAINACLHLDPESKSRLQKLQGKVITIELLPFHFIFQCIFTENDVTIQMDALHPANTTIRGTPLQMVGMMMTKDERNRFWG